MVSLTTCEGKGPAVSKTHDFPLGTKGVKELKRTESAVTVRAEILGFVLIYISMVHTYSLSICSFDYQKKKHTHQRQMLATLRIRRRERSIAYFWSKQNAKIVSQSVAWPCFQPDFICWKRCCQPVNFQASGFGHSVICFFRVHTWVGGLNPNCNAKLNQPKWFVWWWYQINIQNFKSSTTTALETVFLSLLHQQSKVLHAPCGMPVSSDLWSCSVGVVHPSVNPQYSRRVALSFGSKDSSWFTFPTFRK